MSNSLNIREFIKRHFYLFLFFCSAFLTSCEMFNRSVPEFLEYYTSEVMPANHVYDGNFQRNVQSVICYPSENTHYVYVELINVKNYDVGFEYQFDDSVVQSAVEPGDVTFEQSADKKSVKIFFSQSFLFKLDNGEVTNSNGVVKNLSGTLILYQSENGTNVRNFTNTYHIDVNANSAPSRIKGACMLADGVAPHDPSSDERKLYICFNMQNFAGTEHQNDTENLYIAGKHFTFNYSGSSMTVKDDEDNILATSFSSNLYEVGEEDSTHVSSFKTTDYDGFIKYYYDTGILAVNSDASQKYEIKIVDNYGLSSSVKVSAKSEKLNVPEISVSAEPSPDTETKTVTISCNPLTRADRACEGIQYITYRIVDETTNTVYKSVNDPVTSPVNVKVPAGDFKVYASASCEEYIDSDESSQTVSFERSKVYYVKADATNGDGSKNKPFAKITDCLSAIKTRTDLANTYKNYLSAEDECTIKLLSDITENKINFNSSNLGSVRKIVLDGCGNSIKANKEWNILSVASGFDVALTDVTLTGAGETLDLTQITVLQSNNNSNISVSGNLYLCNGTKIVNNFTVCNGADSYNSSLIVVSGNGQLFVEGNVNISGNKYADGTNLASNLYLKSGQVIKCSNKLSDENGNPYLLDGSEIHVSLCDESQIVSGVVITSDFGVNSGVLPSSVFVSDQGYAVRWNGTDRQEAVIASNGNAYVEYKSHDSVKFIADKPIVTNDNNNPPKTTFKAYLADGLEPLSLSGLNMHLFKDGYDTDATISWSTTTNTGTVTFNSYWPKGVYQIRVNAKYNGQDVYGEIPIYYVETSSASDVNDIKTAVTGSSGGAVFVDVMINDTIVVNSDCSPASDSVDTLFNITSGTAVIKGQVNTANNPISKISTASNYNGRVVSVTGADTNVTFENMVFIGTDSLRKDVKGRAVIVNGGATLTLRNCDLSNFYTDGYGTYPPIYVADGKLIIENCKIHGCSMYSNGTYSAAVTVDQNGELIIRDSEISDNRGQHRGSGVYVVGKCYMYNTKVNNNVAQRGAGVFIEAGGSLKMVNCKVTNNKATEGGYFKNCGAGMWIKSRDVVLEDTEISSNKCGSAGSHDTQFNGGGAMFIEGGAVTLKNCTITGNTSSTNGGAFSFYASNSQAAPEIILLGSNIISGNTATGYGNLLYVSSSKGAYYNNTFYSNGSNQ